jgi:hypothetical protein
MRHERFDRDFREFGRTAMPGPVRRAIGAIMSRLANRRPDLRDFGLMRHDIERF